MRGWREGETNKVERRGDEGVEGGGNKEGGEKGRRRGGGRGDKEGGEKGR